MKPVKMILNPQRILTNKDSSFLKTIDTIRIIRYVLNINPIAEMLNINYLLSWR
jgi:hypothetical protein